MMTLGSDHESDIPWYGDMIDMVHIDHDIDMDIDIIRYHILIIHFSSITHIPIYFHKSIQTYHITFSRLSSFLSPFTSL